MLKNGWGYTSPSNVCLHGTVKNGFINYDSTSVSYTLGYEILV